jgi:acetyl-CoA synthetase
VNNAADIKMIVCVNEPEVIKQCRGVSSKKTFINGKSLDWRSREGWFDFNAELENSSEDFPRPTGSELCKQRYPSFIFLHLGQPECQKWSDTIIPIPFGHIVTAKYWQNFMYDGLHLTVADTAWQNINGKNLRTVAGGSAVFVYDFDKFSTQRTA